MAYADQEMTGNKVTAFIIVALIHIALGFALWAAFNYDKIAQAVKRVTTVDIKEEKKEEPPPPPKKDAAPPPPVAPPVQINVSVTPPQIVTVSTPPPPAPVVPIIAPPAPVVAPPPRVQPKGAVPKGNPGLWATSNDYPARALREEREGTSGFRVTVGPDGRVSDCQVTSSSGSPDLDEAACANIRRRARFNPATDGEGQPTTGSYANRVRWVIPKD